MRKIKLNPTREQKLLLNKFADAARFTYNETVAKVNGGEKANKMQLRNQLVTEKDNPFFEDKRWLLETPKVMRQQAVFEAVKNFKAAFTNKKQGHIERFSMGFKSKRKSNGCYVLGLEKNMRVKDGKLHILPSILGHMRHFEKLPFQEVPECDSYIRKDAMKNFWLMVPFKKVIEPRGFDSRPVVSIDPGVRNFLTCYSTSGQGFCLGKDMVVKLMAILRHIDSVDSALSKSHHWAKRRALRRLKLKLYQRYKNVRDEFHWKLSTFLAESHGAILLPHLETQALAPKSRTKTNREMQASSHWLFLQRLKEKCIEKESVFVEAQEHYTSKTCGRCGALNHALGASSVFTCPCGNVCHRDLHAARNILLKHLHVCELPPAFMDAYAGLLDSLHPQISTQMSGDSPHLM